MATEEMTVLEESDPVVVVKPATGSLKEMREQQEILQDVFRKAAEGYPQHVKIGDNEFVVDQASGSGVYMKPVEQIKL